MISLWERGKSTDGGHIGEQWPLERVIAGEQTLLEKGDLRIN